MLFFLFPIYLSFFICVISSPIDSSPNSLDLDDTTSAITDLEAPEPQKLSQYDFETPIAFNKVDQNIEDNLLSFNTIIPNSDENQIDSEYVAINKETSTHSVPNSLIAQKPKIDNCKKRKDTQPCVVAGIDCTYKFCIGLI